MCIGCHKSQREQFCSWANKERSEMAGLAIQVQMFMRIQTYWSIQAGFFWGEMHYCAYSCVQNKKTKNRRNGVLVIYVNFLTFPEWILRLFLQYSLIFFVSLCWCCFVLWQLIELVAEIMSHKCPQANQQNTDSYVSLRIQAQGSLKIPHVLRANVAFGKGVNDYLLL